MRVHGYRALLLAVTPAAAPGQPAPASPRAVRPTRPNPINTQALQVYRELLAFDDPDPMYYVFMGACYYYMGMFKEAEESASQVGHRD